MAKTKKIKGYTILDKEPEAGDLMICVNKKSVNYGLVETVNPITLKAGAIDTDNWKVVMTAEDRQQQIVDEVIESLKEDFIHGDYTILDELLKMIPNKNLVQALAEEDWDKFPEVKEEILRKK